MVRKAATCKYSLKPVHSVVTVHCLPAQRWSPTGKEETYLQAHYLLLDQVQNMPSHSTKFALLPSKTELSMEVQNLWRNLTCGLATGSPPPPWSSQGNSLHQKRSGRAQRKHEGLGGGHRALHCPWPRQSHRATTIMPRNTGGILVLLTSTHGWPCPLGVASILPHLTFPLKSTFQPVVQMWPLSTSSRGGPVTCTWLATRFLPQETIFHVSSRYFHRHCAPLINARFLFSYHLEPWSV